MPRDSAGWGITAPERRSASVVCTEDVRVLESRRRLKSTGREQYVPGRVNGPTHGVKAVLNGERALAVEATNVGCRGPVLIRGAVDGWRHQISCGFPWPKGLGAEILMKRHTIKWRS